LQVTGLIAGTLRCGNSSTVLKAPEASLSPSVGQGLGAFLLSDLRRRIVATLVLRLDAKHATTEGPIFPFGSQGWGDKSTVWKSKSNGKSQD
jgi:hypothetical protein